MSKTIKPGMSITDMTKPILVNDALNALEIASKIIYRALETLNKSGHTNDNTVSDALHILIATDDRLVDAIAEIKDTVIFAEEAKATTLEDKRNESRCPCWRDVCHGTHNEGDDATS